MSLNQVKIILANHKHIQSIKWAIHGANRILAGAGHERGKKKEVRELKQQQRRRQRERRKFAYLVGKNNSFAGAFFTFVHFFAVASKTTTWKST